MNWMVLSKAVGYNTTTPNTRNYRPYYSVNITYSKIKNMNFRVAYSTSLARPELRELTNIFEFDPFQFAVIEVIQTLSIN
ncbi:hypothetical protein [Pedobacter sp. P26]|uniref:hypothetical protein n=1 Tax=Pedobacter sp. P26 TaxID=3423956 RepID=UPI003D66A318